MAADQTAELYYDPFDFDIDDDPYPVWKRMRAEAPLYFNDKYTFYALSRHNDVAAALHDWQTYRSGRGTTADILFSGIEVPPGILLFEDPPLHDLHRRLLSRVFTPRRMLAVEGLVRELCCRALDPRRDSAGFDFVADLGAIMPMRTIGYLLGIPEEAQQLIRDRNDRNLALGPSREGVSPTIFEDSMAMFAEYIEWRATHPSDDLMTDLLNAEVEEADGSRRRLQRTEVLAYTAMIAGAGNETTARLIGFMGQLLGEHPDQRHELVRDPSLIASAVEETLRYEPPSPVQARYVARDVELYGHTVTEGSHMLLLNGSANRDETRFTEPDRYDIRRTGGHLSFGQGFHFCLGAALARLEARVAFEEVLKRWTDWEVDYDNASRARTSSVRGWARLPVKTVGTKP
ncbi:cytochrome P450 family protein [Mycobacterium kansasii 732]|uniref:Cytochrome P450 123 n=1 Tax=Mycobacterium pseudokansasii TaxID=2341080 RepID=A0A498QNF2_9MYCO|nr:cytochrome P450 [Mycobacterium pseudokansasii]EUA08519.1 cytochrome P450 family protein [Mycobacterium kansasii 732]KZS70139.1 cytochrome [Mycobacterium kansasii]MBY0387653.1 cytochrome P450 [Mycobacterium pseudokansasii]VAZ91659.1 Putative cytochrome P450 123 [Mycobacterium pseudokansasii]VAZ92630.1 Putative cytochrome P450 123 [Mycobacterium pseudokansasii]